MTRTLILGAGLAGLTAARYLHANGHEIELIDKGNKVGGRLASLRIGDALLDHGAQFFTTRGAAFTSAVAEAVEAGAVTEWCQGFVIEDGFPRYCGTHGMSSLADWFATGLNVHLNTEVTHIETANHQIYFLGPDGDTISTGDQAIVTAPVPQMLALFDRGNVQVDAELGQRLRATSYRATLALLVVAEGATNIAAPGGIQLDDGPFTFIADNKRKGISPVTALTFHAEHDYSLRRFDDRELDVRSELVELAAPWIGQATVVTARLERWRYAGPITPLPEATYVIESNGTRIALAGDAFAGPKVEGAFNSGLAAAQILATEP